MSDLDRLEAEANARRDEFMASVAELTPQLSPAKLADAAVKEADPEFKFLRNLEISVRRNPVWALAVLAGIWRVVSDARPKEFSPSRHRVRSRAVSLTKKETNHGNHEASLGE
jgi:hypothetical protein